MSQDLHVAIEDIRNFLVEAQQALHCQRVKTSFGKQTSKHCFYLALSDGRSVTPTIVTLERHARSAANKRHLQGVPHGSQTSNSRGIQ